MTHILRGAAPSNHKGLKMEDLTTITAVLGIVLICSASVLLLDPGGKEIAIAGVSGLVGFLAKKNIVK